MKISKMIEDLVLELEEKFLTPDEIDHGASIQLGIGCVEGKFQVCATIINHPDYPEERQLAPNAIYYLDTLPKSFDNLRKILDKEVPNKDARQFIVMNGVRYKRCD